jgi:quinol monooxygenase YgiN
MNRIKAAIGGILMSVAGAQAQEAPPRVAAPDGAVAVVVVLELTAKDPDALKEHLLRVIPVTRQASGIRYSWSTRDPAKPAGFVLYQGWDSLEQQQAYMSWREGRGDLAEFLSFLVEPPQVTVRTVFDR